MKQLAKVGAQTFITLFMVFAYGIGLFSLLFPGTMLRFSDNIGLDNSSAMYARIVATRNPSCANFTVAIDRFMRINDEDRILEFSRKLMARNINLNHPFLLFMELSVELRSELMDEFIEYFERFETAYDGVTNPSSGASAFVGFWRAVLDAQQQG